MNFQVPQFIEIEDKIFGPLSFKQFLYIGGGAGLGFLIYAIPVPLVIKLVPILAVVGFGVALAFYKVNERPFIYVLEAAFKYYTGTKLFLWKKKPNLPKTSTETPAMTIAIGEASPKAMVMPKLSASKLNDLTWSLDVQKNIK